MNVGLYMNRYLFHDDIDEDELPEVRRPHIYRPRINFDRTAKESRQRFRLTPAHVRSVMNTIGPHIQHKTDQNFALSPSQQIMFSLRYLATGDNYRTTADAHGISKATLSRTLHRFVDAVNTHIYPNVVDWPNDPEQRHGIANEFLSRRGMPCVFGCVDGSHIEIVAPSIDEPQFVNRHSRHSINAMFVCGPKLRFYFVDSKWPGAVNDARVFRNSTLKRRLETGWRPIDYGVLLGDSAYANTEYLVGPILNPQNEQERRYNRAHKKTRNVIECAIGVLKQRFRCLLHIMHLKPLFAAEVIRCCVALHNLLMPDDEADAFLEEFDRRRHDEDDHDYYLGDGANNNRRAQLVALF